MRSTSETFPLTLGVLTELEVDRERAALEWCDGFAVVRTPQNPSYYQGNFLIFPRPPQSGESARWIEWFAEAFAQDPRVRHAAFCFDAQSGMGSADEFRAAGYTLEEYDVMTAQSVREFSLPSGLHVRSMGGDADWDAQLAMQLDDVPLVHQGDGYRTFKEAQIAHHRRIAQTLGVWLGVFDGDTLAGSCGIFPVGAEMARYQDVMVAKAYRNRGIARALISAAARWARQHFGPRRFIIVADANDFPRNIYERAGFAAEQREARLWKAERTNSP